MVKLRKLNLKLLRDLKSAKIQFGAVAFVILLGVAMFVALYSAFQNLDVSYLYSYREMRMADYWISLDSVSQRIVKDLEKVPGIVAQGRLVGSIQVELDGAEAERIEGRIISLPMNRPDINNVQVNSGSYFSGLFWREVLLEKSFAAYHNLTPGDYIAIGTEKNKDYFKVQGVVISPEYLWVTKSAQEPMPSPRSFGVLFMLQTETESLLQMEGQYNELNILMEGETNRDHLMTEVINILRKYGIERLTARDDYGTTMTRRSDIFNGVRSAYLIERKDQPSNRMLQQDLDSFRVYAVLFPFLFLGMASLTIYILLNRMVASQRVQIGLLRGLGYGKATVMMHYLGFALLTGFAGSVTGVITGYVLSQLLTSYYITFLNLPVAVVVPHFDTIITGALIGLAVPIIAGFSPAWSVLKLHPAESMRPPAPPAAHRAFVEKIFPFLSSLPSAIKLPFRNILRNPRRSLFMALGIASATILFLVPLSFGDALTSALDTQFGRIQNFDGKIIFRSTGSTALVNLVKHMDGIAGAEPIIETSYRLRFSGRVTDTAIVGLPDGSTMYRLVTPEGEPVAPDPVGILLPLSLKDKLGVEIGDMVQMEPFVGAVGTIEKPVSAFLDFPIGARVFLPLDEVQEMLDAPGLATSILLRFEGTLSSRLLERLNKLPGVAAVELGDEFRRMIDEQMGAFWIFIGVWFTMGAALGLAIIFNGVTVNMLERRREVVTMRALGMANRRIVAMLTLENLMVGLLGIVIGLPLGRYITDLFFSVGDVSDIATLSPITSTTSYIVTVVSALMVMLISQLPAIRQVLRLKLATATKDWSE